MRRSLYERPGHPRLKAACRPSPGALRRDSGRARALVRQLAGEHVQVRAFFLVEQQGAGEGGGAGVGLLAMLQPDVVVDRGSGGRGYFAPRARRTA
jgi:hypothetical protein